MILTRVIPPREREADPVDLSRDDGRARLAELYLPDSPRWLRLNFVASVSGSVTGSDGGSDSLTTKADRVLLKVLRAQADVVLVGAASIRAEGFHVPKRSRLAIVTTTGDLGSHPVPERVEAGRVLVICPEDAAARVASDYKALRAEIVTVPDVTRVAASVIVGVLRDRGLDSIVCEGGPSLAAQLLDAELVDELCLTTSPILAGGGVPLLAGADLAARTLELTQLIVDDRGALYSRWAVPGVER